LIAASNIGYITVFILLSPSYIALRRRQPNLPRPHKLPGIFVPIAAAAGAGPAQGLASRERHRRLTVVP
jgi:amino acid transporter